MSTISARPRAAAVGALAIALTLLASPLPATAAGTQSGVVTGTVFRDFNSDGVMSAGNVATGVAADIGLPGVTVNAYDADNDLVATTSSGAAGAYTLTITSAARTDQLRVEFLLTPTLIAEGYESSYHGTDSGTSVQFVTMDASDVDFAVNVPQDYSQDSPEVAVTQQMMGDPFLQTSGTEYPAISTIPWHDTTTPPAENATINVVTGADVPVGSIYGLAYQRQDDRLLSSAVVRRFAGFGEGGIGGIYQTDDANLTSLLVDVETIGIDVGGTAFSTAVGDGTGTPQGQNAARGLVANIATAIRDADVYPLVGKIGIGGITMNSTDDALFLVNLHEGELVRIGLPASGAAPTAGDVVEGNLAAQLSAGDRPWAVKVWHGRVYVGIIDTTTGPTRSDMSARVISTPEAGFGPTSTWTTEIQFDIDFQRGSSMPSAVIDDRHFWNPWLDTFDDTKILPQGGTFDDGDAITYPQPLLSALSFDAEGNLTMGFADRFGMQTGHNNWRPDNSDSNQYRTLAAGDQLIASRVAGVLTLESNGSTATGLPGTWTDEDGDDGIANNEGPGAGEFYQDNASGHGVPSDPPAQQEIFTGGLAIMAGVSEAIATVIDVPTSATDLEIQDNTAGLVWSGTTTGALAHTLVVQHDGFAKASGLGALELLSFGAPVEIGNRTWYDADNDGIQDADEPPLPDVTVSLQDCSGNPVVDADGNPVLDVLTDADGNYYFSNLIPDACYTVVFDYTTADVSGLTAVFGITLASQLSFTTQEATNSTIGSNPDPVTGEAPVALGGPGQNNHTIDAGFVASSYVFVSKAATGTAAPAGVQFRITLTCEDFRGDPILPITTLNLAAGTDSTTAFPAGTVCDVTETIGHGAVRTTYSVDSGLVSVTPPTGVPIVGTLADPTTVDIVNEFPNTPAMAFTGSTVNGLILPIGGGLLLLGGVFVAFTLIRRHRAS